MYLSRTHKGSILKSALAERGGAIGLRKIIDPRGFCCFPLFFTHCTTVVAASFSSPSFFLSTQGISQVRQVRFSSARDAFPKAKVISHFTCRTKDLVFTFSLLRPPHLLPLLLQVAPPLLPDSLNFFLTETSKPWPLLVYARPLGMLHWRLV